MILRCTAKMLTLVGTRATALPDVPPSDDDWYLNLLWIERRKCLLLTHAGTLFPVFVADVRKADLRPIGPYVVSLVEKHLHSEELAPDTLGRLTPDGVDVAKTASRKHSRRSDTVLLNRFLRRALHNRAGDYVTPLDLVAQRRSSSRRGLLPERPDTQTFG